MNPIPGFPGYSVTKDGRVWSNKRNHGWLKPRLTQKGNGGRLYVVLYRDGVRHPTKYIHRLVLEAYVGPCPKGMEACHKNGNPFDNRLSNLRWDTRSENQRDTVRHGRTRGLKLSPKEVRDMRRLYADGLSQRELSKRYGVDQTTVHYAVTRHTWKHV